MSARGVANECIALRTLETARPRQDHGTAKDVVVRSTNPSVRYGSQPPLGPIYWTWSIWILPIAFSWHNYQGTIGNGMDGTTGGGIMGRLIGTSVGQRILRAESLQIGQEESHISSPHDRKAPRPQNLNSRLPWAIRDTIHLSWQEI